MKKIRIIDDKKQWLPIYCVANLFLIQYLESHSTWVRELKFRHGNFAIIPIGRTPRECVSWNSVPRAQWHPLPGRTPRECVSWNVSVVYQVMMDTGRTPRECVSWNGRYAHNQIIVDVALHVSAWVEITSVILPRSQSPVALHVSAWVEIVLLLIISGSTSSHSTWVRELKFRSLTDTRPPQRRTPRECVSWNLRFLPRLSLQ